MDSPWFASAFGRIEMLPLMHTVDQKVVPAEEEGGGNAEEEHFVDDDVAQAPKAPKDRKLQGWAVRGMPIVLVFV